MSLALATLLYEWRRYTAAIVALAFSGLLILAQIGMFTGIVIGISASIDRSRANIMILPAKMESLINSGGGSLPARLQPQIYMHPEVVEVASWDNDGGRWVNQPKDGKKAVTTFINVNMVDTRPGAATLPVDYPEATRVALLEPYSVAIDESQLKRLGVQLGDAATLNGKTVHVRAILHGYPDLNNASVTMSRDTLRLMGMQTKNGKTGPLMVQIKDPSRAEAVRDELNRTANGAYRAWTREELSKKNQSAIMDEQIIGVFVTFSVFLAFLIGVGITSRPCAGRSSPPSRSSPPCARSASAWARCGSSSWSSAGGWASSASSPPASSPSASTCWPPTTACPWASHALDHRRLHPPARDLGASGLLALGILKKSQPADLLR
jgi:putative ABC transport system permease protein